MKRLSTLLFSFISLGLFGQATPTELSVELIEYVDGINNPVDIQFMNDTMLVIDQNGKIKKVADGNISSEDMLNITSLVLFGGERGLLGMAFDPEFETNRTFYVNYSNNSGNSVIAAYRCYEDQLLADPNTANILLTMNQPYTNHNGGQMQFGPDGYLYIGMGDGGYFGDPEDRSQDPMEFMGKMLRLDVDSTSYAVPDDNPFIDSLDYLPEIWSLGLRNPWRFSFDQLTGDMWIGDVGQNAWEEVDFQPADSEGGENWGWRCYEGNHNYNISGCEDMDFYDAPIFEYSQNPGHCSVTGGHVYRGADSDLLYGIYLGIDYCTGYLFGLERTEDDLIEYDFGNNGFGWTTFGQDPNGEMYVANSDGSIHEIQDPCHTQIPEILVSGNTLTIEDDFDAYHWYLNGEYIDGSDQNSIEALEDGQYYCVVENEYDCNVQSTIVDHLFDAVADLESNYVKLYPNPVMNELNIVLDQLRKFELNLYGMDGKVVLSQDHYSDMILLDLSDIQNGIYLLEIKAEGMQVISERINKQ